MLFNSNHVVTIIAFMTILDLVFCECRQSHVMKCDTFADLKKYGDAILWKELIIGSESDFSPKESVNLLEYDLLPLYSLESLSIVNRLKELIQTPEHICYYAATSLKNLYLYGNDLPVIKKWSFYGRRLEKLVLINNNIMKIEPGSLPVLINYLDISANNLEEIQKNILNILDLNTLIIKNNKLSHIAEEAFSVDLEILNLENNLLKYVQEEALRTVKKLRSLNLSKNKFTEMPKLNFLKSLEILDISHNMIVDVHPEKFKGFSSLKILDISHNKIYDTEALYPLIYGRESFMHLSIAFNRFRELKLKQTLQNVEMVLYGNPWDCKLFSSFEKLLGPSHQFCDSKNFNKGPYCVAELSLADHFEEVLSHSKSTFPCNFNYDIARSLVRPDSARCGYHEPT